MRGLGRHDVMRIGWRAPAFLLASLLVHGAVFLSLRWASTMPSVDFELQLPSHVELGIVHAAAVEAPAPPPTPPEPPAPTTPNEGDEPSKKPKKPKKPKHEPDAAVDAGTADAGVPEREPPPKPEPVASKDAGTGGDKGEAALAAFAPEGAQIALRLHMGALRASKLAEDVRGLLEAVPDWRLIVDGSGIDPLEDLERLFLATPNLQRSSLVVAGQYVGDESLPRGAVARLAAARGVRARWTKRGGMPVAPWPNLDTTARTVALIAPQQFVITRPEDLPRVLLIAKALAARAKEGGAEDPDPGAALLALDDGETLAVSVEGARLFVRKNQAGIPERLEVSVRAIADDAGFAVAITGSYESAERASEAREYWDALRKRFANHFFVALSGMREPLVGLQLEVHEAQLLARTQVSLQQARVLLSFVRGALPQPLGPPLRSPTTPSDPLAPTAPPRGTPAQAPPRGP